MELYCVHADELNAEPTNIEELMSLQETRSFSRKRHLNSREIL